MAGVKGMKWGKRKLTGRQARIAPAKAKGSKIGAATGLLTSQVGISVVAGALRSRALNRLLVDVALKKVNPELHYLVEGFYSEKIIGANYKFADMISSPAGRSAIATGATLTGAVFGGAVGVRVKENRDLSARS